MGGLSLTHWLVVMLVLVVVFGAGKLPRLMGDLATGIKAFKKQMGEQDAEPERLRPVATTADERQPAEGR